MWIKFFAQFICIVKIIINIVLGIYFPVLTNPSIIMIPSSNRRDFYLTPVPKKGIKKSNQRNYLFNNKCTIPLTILKCHESLLANWHGAKGKFYNRVSLLTWHQFICELLNQSRINTTNINYKDELLSKQRKKTTNILEMLISNN